MALCLVPALFAQQVPDNDHYPADQYGDPQPNYAQPGYAQAQPYVQEQNPQQAYPEQSYPQQRYSQQPYSGDSQTESQQGYPAQTELDQGYPPQGGPQNNNVPVQPLSEQQLEQLVAPIALYPDTLVAQVLTASTYPQQIADADQWRRAQGYASSEQIAAGADAQSWDPSVKALTAFPRVLAQLDYNLQWTTELGNAYYNQPQDLLQAVQEMRQRAQAAGNLRSTPQEAVNYEQGNIVLAPVNPQVVYVPEYNPWAVYGQPMAPYPGFSVLGAVGSFIGSAFGPLAIRFGLGIATTAFLHTPFGLLAWGLDWLAHSVLFHGSSYYSHSMTVHDWGLPHGGPRAFGRGGATWANRGYRGPGGYGRPGAGFNAARSPGFSRTPYRMPDRNAFARNRGVEGYNRGYQTSRGYAESSRGSYNSFRPQAGRPQQYARSNYGSGFNGSSFNRSYGGRPSTNYGGSMRAGRSPSTNFQRTGFGRSSGGFKRSGLASSGKQGRSGGSHFGGGHAPKSSGHGHSGGGGHSGGHGHSGGKHH